MASPGGRSLFGTQLYRAGIPAAGIFHRGQEKHFRRPAQRWCPPGVFDRGSQKRAVVESAGTCREPPVFEMRVYPRVFPAPLRLPARGRRTAENTMDDPRQRRPCVEGVPSRNRKEGGERMKLTFNRLLILVLGVFFLGFFAEKLVDVDINVNPRVKGFFSKAREATEVNLFVKGVQRISDFEQESDVKKLEVSKAAVERSDAYASRGTYSLKVTFPDGGGAVGYWATLPRNWVGYKALKFDVYSEEGEVPLSLFIADTRNTSYYDRFNRDGIALRKGWNNIEIPIEAIDRKLIMNDINHMRIFLWKVPGRHVLYFDNIRLVSGDAEEASVPAAEQPREESASGAEATAVPVKKRKVPVSVSGPVSIVIDPASEGNEVSELLWGSNLCAKMESNTIIRKLVRHLGLTCFRFPGGGSPGWRWKTGEGDFSPKMKRMMLADVDYLVDFLRDTGTELIMQVNIESGTAEEAAELVRYLNKEKDFRVEYWELGNEAYGGWDNAHTTAGNYAKIVREYSTAMKAVDPTIKIGANWGETYYNKVQWDQTILKEAGRYIDFVSIHWYPNHINKEHAYKGRVHPYPKEVMANHRQIPRMIERVHSLIDTYAPYREGEIEVTFLEWDGAWDAPSSDPSPPFAEGNAMWSLANALFYADTLGEFARHGVTVSAHYNFQECMFGLIRGWDKPWGWGGSPWDQKIIRPKGYAIQLYADHFGDVMVESHVHNSPVYYKENDWWPSSYTGEVPYVTCYASKFKTGNKLGVILVNKHEKDDIEVKMRVKGTNGTMTCTPWVLTGPGLMESNENSPDSIAIEAVTEFTAEGAFEYTLPARSVTALEIEL
ncbi:MAG: hypothetical protein GF333_00590 [Candidatus Omnitrophica bacterium]|nr:hypothetical protein [Candidatus Omnitrophota bacterium]